MRRTTLVSEFNFETIGPSKRDMPDDQISAFVLLSIEYFIPTFLLKKTFISSAARYVFSYHQNALLIPEFCKIFLFATCEHRL